MPATKYMKDHVQRCVASANAHPYLPHLDPATPECDVSQVIPIGVLNPHVIALKLFLTRWFEDGKRNHYSASSIIDELHRDPTIPDAFPDSTFTLLERLRAENPISKTTMVFSIQTQYKRIRSPFQSSHRLLSLLSALVSAQGLVRPYLENPRDDTTDSAILFDIRFAIVTTFSKLRLQDCDPPDTALRDQALKTQASQGDWDEVFRSISSVRTWLTELESTYAQDVTTRISNPSSFDLKDSADPHLEDSTPSRRGQTSAYRPRGDASNFVGDAPALYTAMGESDDDEGDLGSDADADVYFDDGIYYFQSRKPPPRFYKGAASPRQIQ